MPGSDIRHQRSGSAIVANVRKPRREAATKRKFYQTGCSVRSRPDRYTLLNGDRLFPGYGHKDATPEERSAFLKPEVPFQDFPETPVFMCDVRRGPVYWDFENPAGYWFISERMKSVLQAMDPEAVEFLQCHVLSPDGQELPARWFCAVVRILDALDEEKSEVKIDVASDGSKIYSLLGRPKLIFDESIVADSHIFRMKYAPGPVICDNEMRQACKSARLTGIYFLPTER